VKIHLPLALIAIAFAAVAARAGETPINLTALANEPWTYVGPNDFLIINGDTFPIGTQNFGGVPFAISSGPNNYWAGAAAADFGPGTVGLTIPVGIFGAYIYVTFNGSNGATKTVPLVGNVNVRDYNQDGNTNSINNTSTIQVWDNGLGQRLDRQEYLLPPEFADQTLDSITITDTGDEGNGTNGSRTVLAALTVSTCFVYVTETITVSSSNIVYHPAVKLYQQNVYLENTGTAPVVGPLYFILEDLPPGVTVVNNSGGTTDCMAPLGSRYVVALPEGTTLAPNTSVTLHLAFSDPSGTAITYTPLTTGSVGGRP
jgi:hypothetical protein